MAKRIGYKDYRTGGRPSGWLFTMVASSFGWGSILETASPKSTTGWSSLRIFSRTDTQDLRHRKFGRARSKVSPVIARSSGEKAAMGKFVALSESDKTLVLYNPSTKATVSISLETKVFVYRPGVNDLVSVPPNSLPPGTGAAAVKPRTGDSIDKIFVAEAPSGPRDRVHAGAKSGDSSFRLRSPMAEILDLFASEASLSPASSAP